MNLYRPYYNLTEVIGLVDPDHMTVEDLVFLASNGQLPIFVLTEFWAPRQIIKVLNEPPEPTTTQLDTVEKFSALPFPYSDPSYLAALRCIQEVDEHGPEGSLFKYRASGPCLVPQDCFKGYLKNPDTTVWLDMLHMLKVGDEYAKQLRFVPEEDLLVRDAIADNKLVVMATDVRQLKDAVPLRSVPSAEPLLAQAAADDPSHRLSHRKVGEARQDMYQRWQTEAEKLKQRHPSWTKSRIVRVLAGQSSEASTPLPTNMVRDFHTMRKVVKI